MEPTEHNRRAWDDAHRHAVAGAEPNLPSPVRRALADLTGKNVLNVNCGIGEAAAQLADLGATVTGVDDTPGVLDVARERWPRILWIEGNIEALPRELQRGRFDLVYAGERTLARVTNLRSFADGAAGAVRTSGDLLLYDEHPVARCVDGLMHWRESYFEGGMWRLGQIVSAVARAGFTIRAVEEYPTSHPNTRHHDARIPGAFLLYAQRS